LNWQDANNTRKYGTGDNGGGWRAGGAGFLRRVFGDGENPLTWALPLYTAWDIRVRVHIVLVLFTLGRVLWSFFNDTSVTLMLGWMGSLWILILLHEYGHCFAARRVGGDADEIILWPLGGLAMCQVPDTWKANLLVALAGPAVNVVLLPVFAISILLAVGDPSVIFFNPLNPIEAMQSQSLSAGSNAGALAKQLLVAAHQTNFYLLAFNMLVPMFPMDAGRVLHALIWKKRGQFEATGLASRVGLFLGVAMIVAGLVLENITLAAIGLFGGLLCWQELRIQRFEADPVLGGGFSSMSSTPGMSGIGFDPDDEPPSKRELKKQAQQESVEQEVDLILEKISSQGMASLTAQEKKTLKKASESKRKS
jgi:Zn-dependent protease